MVTDVGNCFHCIGNILSSSGITKPKVQNPESDIKYDVKSLESKSELQQSQLFCSC